MSIMKLWDETSEEWKAVPTLKGDQGIPGAGLIPGGTIGQVLKKKSELDQDTEWGDAADLTNYYTKTENDVLLDEKLDNSHNTNETAHNDIRQDISDVDAIARGKARARVFDTVVDLDIWLSTSENVETLLVGDNFYIRDVEVPDYWWDGTQKQELETEKVDLTNYYTKTQVDAKMPILITRTDYDALVSAGTVQADRLYDIIEEV